jgi:hypothetical protein
VVVDSTTGVYRVETDLEFFENAREQQIVLNSFFSSDNLIFTPSLGFIGDATINVTVFSTEKADGDGLAPLDDAKQKSVTKEILIVVNPDR